MLNIITETGIRLDIDPKATIEVNMGGVSLLNLADRTATYTNSFKLPRTQTNESVFAFASQPTRNNRPVVNVLINKGLFQHRALLKLVDSNSDSYNCTINYDYENVLTTLNGIDFHSLPQNNYVIKEYDPASPSPTNVEVLQFIASDLKIDGRCFVPATYGLTAYKSNNAAMSIGSILARIQADYGYTFTGDMLTNTQFINTFIFDKYVLFTKYYNVNHWEIRQTKTLSNVELLPFSTLIKTLSQIFFFDIKIEGKNISINSILNDLGNTAIHIEGFDSFTKKHKSDYLAKNYVNYKTNATIDKTFGGDVVIGEGVGTKTLLEINSFIPKAFGVSPILYSLTADEALSNTVIMASSGATINSMTFDGTTFDNVSSHIAEPLTMVGFYSTPLNPIFADPVILESDRYIDPLTADAIMTNRTIISVQLGGRYWVDSMAYNLTTGQSKMTLIKLT